MSYQSGFLCPDCKMPMKFFQGPMIPGSVPRSIWDCLRCYLWTTSSDPYWAPETQRLLKRINDSSTDLEFDVRGKDFDECMRRLKLGAFE